MIPLFIFLLAATSDQLPCIETRETRHDSMTQVATLALACGLLAVMPRGRWQDVEMAAAAVAGARSVRSLWLEGGAAKQITLIQFTAQALQVRIPISVAVDYQFKATQAFDVSSDIVLRGTVRLASVVFACAICNGLILWPLQHLMTSPVLSSTFL